MVGRIDDCAKFLSENLTCNFQNDECSILTRLCWSKNVRTEADAPEQILMGAQHPNYCVLLCLATWLDFSVRAYGSGQKFVFNYRSLHWFITIKENADKILKNVLSRPEFTNIELVTGKKGTHSMRKFATTFARRNGCVKDNVDLRARWKGKGRQLAARGRENTNVSLQATDRNS